MQQAENATTPLVLGLAYLVGQKFHVRRGKPKSQGAAILLFSLRPLKDQGAALGKAGSYPWQW